MLKATVIALITFIFSATLAAAVVFGQTPTTNPTATPASVQATASPTPSIGPTGTVQGASDTRIIPGGAPGTGRAE